MSAQFTVIYSQAIKKMIADLRTQAAVRGDQSDFLLALVDLDNRLRESADSFGEPLFDLKHLQLQVRKGICRPVVASWGVHRTLPLAFLRHLTLLGKSKG